MKKLIAILFAAAMTSTLAAAQSTATGTLTVTATVNSSITLTFVTDANGVALGSSGTNAATLAFGSVQAFGGTLATNVTRTTGASSFTVSSPVDVKVDKANAASASYKLTAQLGTADGNTWSVGGVGLSNTAANPITATGAYGTATNFPVAVTIPFSVAGGTSINNSIIYTATAN